jgi:glycosyltransferase involved in cell wall biosynthesis
VVWGRDPIVRESQPVKIVVIIPTYNERENVGLLIDELQARFPSIGHDMAILVVDDNSPGGLIILYGNRPVSVFRNMK